MSVFFLLPLQHRKQPIINNFILLIMANKKSLSDYQIRSLIDAMYLKFCDPCVYQSVDGKVLTITIPSCSVTSFEIHSIFNITDCYFHFDIYDGILTLNFLF